MDHDPATCIEGGITEEGLGIIDEYVRPEIQESTLAETSSLKLENRELKVELENLLKNVGELNSGGVSETGLGAEDLHSQYLEDSE